MHLHTHQVKILNDMSVTLILSVAVTVPDCADSVMLCFVLAGSPFASEEAAGLIYDARQSFQRLKSSIYCICHVGTVHKIAKRHVIVKSDNLHREVR